MAELDYILCIKPGCCISRGAFGKWQPCSHPMAEQSCWSVGKDLRQRDGAWTWMDHMQCFSHCDEAERRMVQINCWSKTGKNHVKYFDSQQATIGEFLAWFCPRNSLAPALGTGPRLPGRQRTLVGDLPWRLLGLGWTNWFRSLSDSKVQLVYAD